MTPRDDGQQVAGDDQMYADAWPTKELFIEMLTRDLSLTPAIVDLVDNCADGATRLRGTRSFDRLTVRIEVSPDSLRISDKCGGIDFEIARDYAFRFGRPEKAPSIKHSIGRFGVGMKRALFKIGKRFQIESTAERSRFTMDVSVPKWAAHDRWEFPFQEVQLFDKKVPPSRRGTIVTITELHDDVAEQFAQGLFLTGLEAQVRSRMQEALARGLAISLNQVPIHGKALQFLEHSQLRPAYKKLTFRALGQKPVTVKLYCGLGVSESRATAGWYVFCNGRLLLEADKSDDTGWGTRGQTPSFHPQYNSFRGYAFFDSDDAGLLPWNTTKTGLDTDSPAYRAAIHEMRTLMQPVIAFLNRLKQEKQDRAREGLATGPLETLVRDASPKAVSKVRTRPAFSMPKFKARPPAPRMQRIQYDRPIKQVNVVKKRLGVTTFVAVGEQTFDYYYNAECEE